jgi:hypothetical protein
MSFVQLRSRAPGRLRCPGACVLHCADDGCVQYASLAAAQAACAAALSCGGLTNDPATGGWGLPGGHCHDAEPHRRNGVYLVANVAALPTPA